MPSRDATGEERREDGGGGGRGQGEGWGGGGGVVAWGERGGDGQGIAAMELETPG